MRRIILPILILFLLLTPLNKVQAHPVDTSTMILYLGTNVVGQPVGDNQIEGVLTFNWLQLSSLTKENKSPIEIYKNIGNYDQMLYSYLSSNISIVNNEKVCNYNLKRFVEVDVNNVINLGIRYQLEGNCDEKIENLKVLNNAFKDQILTQSNKIILYQNGKSVSETDDGNLIYGRSDSKTEVVETNNFNEKILTYFNNILNSDNFWTIPLIFTVIFILGMLHSLEGGHNKIILGSLVIDKKINLRDSFLFTIIFTLTHMSDIILLSIGLLFLNRYLDLYSLIPNLTVYTSIFLLILSGYSLIKELRHILSHKLGLTHHHQHNHNHVHEHEHKELVENKNISKMLLIAFVSGLAPCITGWSIFMLLFSTGRVNLVLPGMIFFGLGVFFVLSVYTLILHKSKSSIIKKASWLTEYSTLISMSLVFVSTIIQIIAILT